MPAVSEDGFVQPHDNRPFREVSKGYTRFRDGDVLFAKITPCMENGKAAIAMDLKNGLGCGSTEFHVLRPNAEILAEYLWRFVRQRSFRVEAERHMTGAVGQRRVPADFLKETILDLPPVDEQRRILERLRGLLTRSNQAGKELDRVGQLVPRFGQALIDQLCQGSPTRLGELVTDVRYGTSQKCYYEPRLTPVLRIPNVVGGRIDATDLKFSKFTAADKKKLALEPGDVLIVRSNGSRDLVGRAALVTPDVAGFLYAGYLIRLRVDSGKVYPPYLLRVLQSLSVRRQIEAAAKSTSGVNNINADQLRDLLVPLPSLEQQRRIADRVNDVLSSYERLRGEAERAQSLRERFEESALEKAFAGELGQG